MVERGYTERQVRRLVEWYMRVKQAGCVQSASAIENALRVKDLELVCAGRTDTGVLLSVKASG